MNTFLTSATGIPRRLNPAEDPRPQSNTSFSVPASTSVLIPSRCALMVGPPFVPSSRRRSSPGSFGIERDWA